MLLLLYLLVAVIAFLQRALREVYLDSEGQLEGGLAHAALDS